MGTKILNRNQIPISLSLIKLQMRGDINSEMSIINPLLDSEGLAFSKKMKSFEINQIKIFLR